MPFSLIEMLRLLLLFEIFCCVFYVIRICSIYIRRRKQPAKTEHDQSQHVFFAGGAFLGFCIYCFVEVFSRLGQGWTWRTPVLLPIFTIFLISFYSQYSHQAKMLQAEK